ncbi:hypothetical protein MHC_03630 [Mycoplasma haemocanis str. Illinois]|uniref:Uncharacterized protein n=1 Tax=Mycoplasma haemocanis (strain Illinois) TaxID=1111676 RepID=H6N7G4_MYCHN|nr:hypothetical protein [Mycoplasma haemocanis]AEW45586.1 hypothetical protein MHC_03630 [Mycoplasma haemocanis str. Illinois]
MSKLAGISLIGVGATGAVGLGAYLIKSKSSPSFSQKIDTNKRVILDAKGDFHNTVWTQIVEEYKQKGNIAGIPKDSKVQENLKKYCLENKDATFSSTEKFEQYLNYCTRENLMTKLPTTQRAWNTSKEESKWATAETSYKALTDSSDDKGLLIPKDNGNIEKGQITKQDIMKHCESISSKPFINTTDADYKRGEKWCLITNG